MAEHKCPKCSGVITRTWVNKKRGHQLVGACTNCKRTVNLGKATPEQRNEAARRKATEKAATRNTGKAAKSAAAGAGKNGSPAPAGSGKRDGKPGPFQPGGGVPKSKRGGIGQFFRDLLDI